jgi:hypothetical protein
VAFPAPEPPRHTAIRQGLTLVLMLCALDLLRYLEQMQVGTDRHGQHMRRIAAAWHALATLTRMRRGSHSWQLAAWQAYIICQHALAGAPPGEDEPGWPKAQAVLGQAMQTLLILQRVLD